MAIINIKGIDSRAIENEHAAINEARIRKEKVDLYFKSFFEYEQL